MEESGTVSSISPPPSSYTVDTTLVGSTQDNDWDDGNSTLAKYIEKKRRRSSSDVAAGTGRMVGKIGQKQRKSKDDGMGDDNYVRDEHDMVVANSPSASQNSNYSRSSFSKSSMFGFNCIKQACWFLFSWILFLLALFVNYFGTASFWGSTSITTFYKDYSLDYTQSMSLYVEWGLYYLWTAIWLTYLTIIFAEYGNKVFSYKFYVLFYFNNIFCMIWTITVNLENLYVIVFIILAQIITLTGFLSVVIRHLYIDYQPYPMMFDKNLSEANNGMNPSINNDDVRSIQITVTPKHEPLNPNRLELEPEKPVNGVDNSSDPERGLLASQMRSVSTLSHFSDNSNNSNNSDDSSKKVESDDQIDKIGSVSDKTDETMGKLKKKNRKASDAIESKNISKFPKPRIHKKSLNKKRNRNDVDSNIIKNAEKMMNNANLDNNDLYEPGTMSMTPTLDTAFAEEYVYAMANRANQVNDGFQLNPGMGGADVDGDARVNKYETENELKLLNYVQKKTLYLTNEKRSYLVSLLLNGIYFEATVVWICSLIDFGICLRYILSASKVLASLVSISLILVSVLIFYCFELYAFWRKWKLLSARKVSSATGKKYWYAWCFGSNYGTHFCLMISFAGMTVDDFTGDKKWYPSMYISCVLCVLIYAMFAVKLICARMYKNKLHGMNKGNDLKSYQKRVVRKF